jgi:hypothetical protein
VTLPYRIGGVTPPASSSTRAAQGSRAHLKGCPACAEDHDSHVALLASESVCLNVTVFGPTERDDLSARATPMDALDVVSTESSVQVGDGVQNGDQTAPNGPQLS